MENCGGLPHCGLDPQSHPIISLNKHRDTEQQSFLLIIISVSQFLCVYICRRSRIKSAMRSKAFIYIYQLSIILFQLLINFNTETQSDRVFF